MNLEASLYWAAAGHVSLLPCLALVGALYGSDTANHVYLVSPYGRAIFQPLAKSYVVLAPAILQVLIVVAHRWRAALRVTPLVIVMALSLVLRFWGLEWGLPGQFHPDEGQYGGQAYRMLATGDMHPKGFGNPSLMIYVTYWVYGFVSQRVHALQLASDFFNLGIVDPRDDLFLLLAARAVSALAGTLTVAGVYLAGKELFNRRVGLLSSALLSVAFLHVRNSHYATNDILATFLLVVSFLFSARVYSRGAWADYLLAGLLGGLATSTKYNVGFFWVPLLIAHLARLRLRPGVSPVRSQPPLLLSAIGALLGFLLGTPYALLDLPSFLRGFRGMVEIGAVTWQGQAHTHPTVQFMAALSQGVGPAALALAGIGLAIVAWRREAAGLILAAMPLCYLVFMSSQQLFFARFAMPAVPFVALLAGVAISDLSGRIATSRWVGVAPVAMVLLAMGAPFLLSVQHDQILGRSDTRGLAAAWIEQYVPPHSIVAVETHAVMDNPYGWRGNQRNDPRIYWVRDVKVFWPEKADHVARVLEGEFDYVVVSSFGYDTVGPGKSPSRDGPNVYEELERKGRLVFRIGPGPGGTDVPYALDDSYTPFWTLSHRERPGPTIKIYETGDGKWPLPEVSAGQGRTVEDDGSGSACSPVRPSLIALQIACPG